MRLKSIHSTCVNNGAGYLQGMEVGWLQSLDRLDEEMVQI